ncbi:MAG TPA: VTT domain-containing protein [Gaiellaceae bacterium]|nr:VTT domain-containing protein [Gaiellaceae bacterium]
MVVASFTSFVGDHAVYAVFGLMAVAAVLPAASELVMVYAGAVVSGAFASQHVVLFGDRIHSHPWAYVTVAITGALGNTVGAGIGWAIGFFGGRPLLERYGKLLHVTDKRMERAESWFQRFGRVAVPLGFAAPVVRSFVAIPAGLFRERLPQFLPLAAIGCTVFCFGLAGGGWALGSSYNKLHDALTYVGIALVVLVVVALAVVWYRKRSSTIPGRAEDSAR